MSSPWARVQLDVDFEFDYIGEVGSQIKTDWKRPRPDLFTQTQKYAGVPGLYHFVLLDLPDAPASTSDGDPQLCYVGESGDLGARLEDYYLGRGKHGRTMQERLVGWSERGSVQLWTCLKWTIRVNGDPELARHMATGGFDRLLVENAALVARECDWKGDVPLLNAWPSRQAVKVLSLDDDLPF